MSDSPLTSIMLAMSDVHNGTAEEAEAIGEAIVAAIEQGHVPRVSIAPEYGSPNWRSAMLHLAGECDRLRAIGAAAALRTQEFYTP